MKLEEIEKRFQKTIDQYFRQLYLGDEKERLYYVGGILKSALHILPLDNYYKLKEYIYKTYGYDAGGVKDGQMSMDEFNQYYL